MRDNKIHGYTLASTLAVMVSASASAPEAEAAAVAGSEVAGPAATIDEIVVTARRREENLQDVPVAVTVVSGESLREMGILDVRDLAFTVPSLTATNVFSSNHVNFTIRGQAPENNNFGNAPTVEIYFADVPQLSPSLAQLYDIQSVQVVRGPQGTLFGRASNGGAVLFTPTQPEDRFDAYVTGQVGNYDDREVQAAVTIPIGESLSMRLAGNLVRRDGFAKILNQNDYDLDNRHSEAVRMTLAYRPTDWVRNTLLVDYSDVDQHQSYWQLVAARPNGAASLIHQPANPAFQNFLAQNPDLAAIPGVAGGLQTYLQTARALGPRRVYYNTPAEQLIYVSRVTNAINRTEVDIGEVTIKNIFGYQQEYLAAGYSADASPFPILDGYQPTFAPMSRSLDRHQYSNELQLFGKLFDDRLEWLLGGYYQHRQDDEPGNSLFGKAFSILGTNATSALNEQDQKSRAIFTQHTFSFTDRWRATGGFRRTWDENDAQQYLFFTPINARGDTSGPTVCPGTNIPASADAPECKGTRSLLKSHGDNWTIGTDYRFSDGLMSYVSVKRGYRPGGIATTAVGTLFREYDPESITEVEAGIKLTHLFADVATRLNIAAFDQSIDDAQRGFLIFNPLNNQTQGVTLNAAKAKVRGVEIEAEAVFGDTFRLSVSGDYTDAGYDTFDVPIIGVDPSAPQGLAVVGARDASNNPFPNVPEWHATANAVYTLPLDRTIGTVDFTINYSYQSSIVFSTDYEREPEGFADGRSLVNARVDWEDVLGRPLDVGLFVRNAFDETYLTGGIALQQQLGFTHASVGEPRTYGASVRYRFGD